MRKNHFEERKKKNSIGLVISLLLAILVFIVLVIFSSSVSRSRNSATVLIALRNIAENTVIKKADAANYFRTVAVPEEIAYEGTYTSVDALFANGDIYVTKRLKANEVVSADIFTKSNTFVQAFTDPVEMGIKASSFDHAAGGILRRGDVVDICNVDEFGAESSVTLYILKAFDSEGTLIEAEDETSVAVAFNVLLERKDYMAVAEVIALGAAYDLIKLNDVQ